MKIKTLLSMLLAGVLLVGCNGGTDSSPVEGVSSVNIGQTNLVAATTTVTGNPTLSGQFITASYEQNGVLYIGTNMGLYISSDNGNAWTVINPKDTGLANSNYIYDVAVDGSTIYMLVGNNNFGNYTLMSKDNGKSWKHFGTPNEDASSMFLVGHDIYLVNGGLNMQSTNTSPMIAISHDQGTSWITLSRFDNIPYILSLYVDKTNTNNIYFIAPDSFSVYGSQDGGKTWVSDYALPDSSMNSRPTSVVAKGNSVFVGTTNGLLFSSEGLAYGSPNCSSSSVLSCGAYFGTSNTLTTTNGLGSNNISKLTLDSDNDKLFVATNNGYSVTTNISDAVVLSLSNYTSSVYNDLPSSQINNVYINDHVAIIDTNNGISVENNSNTLNWAQPIESNTTNIYAILVNSNMYFAGYNQGLVMGTTDSTNNVSYKVKNSSLNDPYSWSVFADGESNIYVGSLGGLSISHDGGNTWINKNPTNGLTAAVKSVAASGNDIYLGTYGSGLLTSHDGGNTWKKENIKATNDLIYKIFIGSNGAIYVGTYKNGLYISTDKGNSWKACDYYINDPLNASFTVKDIFIVGQGMYLATPEGVYISYDSGKTWTKTNNNLNGQAVNSIYVSAGNIYVGLANGSVAVSLNGGKNFSYTELSNTYMVNAIYEAHGTVIVGNRNTTVYGTAK